MNGSWYLLELLSSFDGFLCGFSCGIFGGFPSTVGYNGCCLFNVFCSVSVVSSSLGDNVGPRIPCVAESKIDDVMFADELIESVQMACVM